MTRPALNAQLSAETFQRWYWLKDELVAFCRSIGIPSGGSKQTLTERIARYLTTGEKSVLVPPKPASKGQMPANFTRETVIGPGWTCSQALRAFFEQELGLSFRFDATLRDFIHHGQGKTLQEAILAWENAQANPVEKEIAPQFEYNRHIRAYLNAHPGAGLKAAIRAWEAWKQHPQE